MPNVYGIDLGTTYSAISYINETGRAEIIRNAEGLDITPSIVFFESPDNIVVGEAAKTAGRSGPVEAQRVVNFVKREMHDKTWTREFFGREWNPVGISSLILQKLVNDARTSEGHEVRDVVITCPAYFGNEERTRTRQSGEAIGLNVLEILDEPVAAALNYGLEQSNVKGKNIIVYDLGGGTFDVTVITIGNVPDKTEISVVCTAGDHQLGGYNWDQKITDYFVSEFEDATGTSISAEDDPDAYTETMYDLKIGAEDRKKELTGRNSVTQTIRFGTGRHRCELTREKFDDLTKELLQTTLDLADKVVKEASDKGVKIDTWLLVGGSTRMPQVHEALAQKYGLTENVNLFEYDPDKAVAKGAAKEAQVVKLTGILRRGYGETDEPTNQHGGAGEIPTLPSGEVLRNAAAELGMTEEQVRKVAGIKPNKAATKSYGVGVLNENDVYRVNILIKRNTQVPFGGKLVEQKTFGAPGGDSIGLEVFSSDETGDVVDTMGCDKLEDNETHLSEIPFLLPVPVAKGAPIAIKFELDEQGNLKLFATDLSSGESKEARFTAGLTEAQMEEVKENLRLVTVS